MDPRIELNPNEVVAFLGKHPGEFTRADMLKFIREKGIRMIDFMYPAEDGRVKTLNFTVNNLAYAETILTEGERVDGSSLFPSFIEAGNSDLYVLPRYRTAFVDPFNEIPTLCFLCSFFDKNGEPFDCAPYQTLMRAEDAFYQSTGMTFEAMGELEYYVITDADPLFPATDQKGYHESEPFAKLNDFRRACMVRVAQTGGQIKYGHSEVGNFTLNGKIYEQNEIEFLPNPVETAADQLLLAKWVIRNLAYQWGLDVSFAPKITTGKAGSGMHIHKSENAARLSTLDSLPTCCAESAACLEAVREVYEADDVFKPRMIDGIISSLKAHHDKHLHADAKKDPALMRKLVDQYFYCG